MSRPTIWQTIYERFDPEVPARPEWRAARDLSPADVIVVALDRPGRTPKVLLTGTMGTGKTTELLRVAEARAQKGDEFVIFIDLVRHFRNVVGDAEALQHVSAWEVCFLVGVALIRAAEDQLGYSFTPNQVADLANAWTELAKATVPAGPVPPQIDVPALAKSMVLVASAVASPSAAAVSGVKVLSELISTVKWTVPMGRRGSTDIEDQHSAMKQLLQSVNVLVGTFQQWNRRVLFVVDGLDRIEDFDRAQSLLLRSELIQSIDCPLVICGPFALRHHLAAATMRKFDKVSRLHNAPVLDEHNPAVHGPGVQFLCELYERRVSDLRAGALLPRQLLERLAYYSGGRSRDFVRLIRMLADRGYDTGAETVTAAMVDDVLDESRLLLETGLTREHIQALEQIARDPNHDLPGGRIAQELLTYGRLLPYPNKSEWFYPHPLLTLHKVKTGPTGSSASSGSSG